jgi:RimJ/RimL family protein N-acetyltransferase
VKPICSLCDTRNVASWKVMLKAGMRMTDHLRAHREVKGELTESFCFEISARHAGKDG